MNKKIFFWSITVALGGFLFGFDTAVISGAEQAIQKLWLLNDFEHGMAVAIALYGTVIGALFGGIPSERYGRKKTLFWVGILYLVSAVGSALAIDPYSFMIFRFIGGLGVGASSVVAPTYISEISPRKSRGRLVALFQFNIVFGIVIAYLSNFLLSGLGENAWRWMVGVEGIPALAFSVMVLTVPRSPRWLMLNRDNEDEAREVLHDINPQTVEESVNAIHSSKHDQKSSFSELFSGSYKIPLMLAFGIAFLNQMSGINAIIYYAPRIFESTGLGASSSLLSTTGIGITNLIFTMLGMALIDRSGRRTLMFVGSVGLILSLGLVSRAFFANSFAGVPIFLFGFIAAFALSQGAVIWVFISEIFPNHIRSYGQSFGSFIHWLMAAIIANIFPFFANHASIGEGKLFMFFSTMMLIQLIFVWKIMPETKGVSLEDLEAQLSVKKTDQNTSLIKEGASN